MSGLIDTNVFVYSVNEESLLHGRAAAFVHGIADVAGPWYVTHAILYEFLRVSTHPRIFSRPLKVGAALSIVRTLVDDLGIRVLKPGPDHWQVAQELAESVTPPPSGNLLYDLRTVAMMREAGIRRIYTNDTDFHRFRDIEVVDIFR